VVERSGWIGGEENRERGYEEKGEHGRDEDPEGEEALETESTENRSSSGSASGSSDSYRHWIEKGLAGDVSLCMRLRSELSEEES
jgi:hypothetical protein